MTTVIIGDLHFGIKIGDDRFIEYQVEEWKKFINGYCRVNNVNQIVVLGDFFDNRNYLSVKILDVIKNQIVNTDIELIILVGNHDTLYRNSIRINTPRLIFEDTPNVKVVDSIKEIYIDDVKCLFIPWITKENYDDTLAAIKKTEADYCFGHFEITNFEMTSGIKCIAGLSAGVFKKFKGVFSGHFHLVQKKGNIHYLGSFYQTTWTDCGDQKFIYAVGDDFTLTPIPQTRSIYKKIYLTKDAPITQEIVDSTADSYVNVYLSYKMKAKDEKLLSKMFDCAIKVDVIDLRLLLEEDDRDVDDEDFLEIFNGFMDLQEDLDDELKEAITILMKKTYSEALEE